jgi:WD40 repeat protein
MLTATLRRWRTLRPRGRSTTALLAATALLIGLGQADRWRTETWPATAVLRTPGNTWPLAFSPDGRRFLTFGRGGITPWDIPSGRRGEAWGVEPGGAAVTGAFSPDGGTFAAAVFNPSQALSIELLDASTGRSRATLSTPHQSVFQLSFTADGRTLRACLGDYPQVKEVVSWDVATGRESSSRPLTSPPRGAFTAISPEGRLLVIAAPGANAVQLWDVERDRPLGGLANPSSTSIVAWGGVGLSRDGQSLAVGREDGTIEIWDLPTRRLRGSFPCHTDGHVSSLIRFSPDGRSLASCGDYRWATTAAGRIMEGVGQMVWSALGPPRPRPVEVVVLEVASGRRLGCAAESTQPSHSPDGGTLATREPDGSVGLRGVPRPPGLK